MNEKIIQHKFLTKFTSTFEFHNDYLLHSFSGHKEKYEKVFCNYELLSVVLPDEYVYSNTLWRNSGILWTISGLSGIIYMSYFVLLLPVGIFNFCFYSYNTIKYSRFGKGENVLTILKDGNEGKILLVLNQMIKRKSDLKMLR
jgi:hypothetical protein